MGIILGPIYIGAFIIYFFCIKQMMKWYTQEALSLPIILLGMFISLLILSGIVLSYYFKERVYALSPMFRIPFCLFYIPGIFCFLLMQSKNLLMGNISKSMVVSILFSGFLILLFNKYIFGILDYLKIEQYY